MNFPQPPKNFLFFGVLEHRVFGTCKKLCFLLPQNFQFCEHRKIGDFSNVQEMQSKFSILMHRKPTVFECYAFHSTSKKIFFRALESLAFGPEKTMFLPAFEISDFERFGNCKQRKPLVFESFLNPIPFAE